MEQQDDMLFANILVEDQKLVFDHDKYENMIRQNFCDRGIGIMKERYLRKGETMANAMWRICKCVASGRDGAENDRLALLYLEHLMSRNRFLPNTPTWTGASAGKGQLAACFVLPIEDTMESIFGTLRDAALVQSTGGGTGFTFGHLRPRGAVVNSSQGSSSGPVSFIKVYDNAFAAVQQGG